jgi:hypothetical protein
MLDSRNFLAALRAGMAALAGHGLAPLVNGRLQRVL